MTDDAIKTAYDAVDTNGDGQLSQHEVEKALSMLSLRRDTNSARLFQLLDADGERHNILRVRPQLPRLFRVVVLALSLAREVKFDARPRLR
jgi:hypothetical protein